MLSCIRLLRYTARLHVEVLDGTEQYIDMIMATRSSLRLVVFYGNGSSYRGGLLIEGGLLVDCGGSGI